MRQAYNRAMCRVLRLLLPALALTLGSPGPGRASATTVYQCVGNDGRTVFQDKPCRAGQHERVLALPDAPATTPPTAQPPAPPVQTATVAPAPPAVAPLPVMYTCTRATDGKSYLSQNGNPPPYQAPYGVLGAEQRSLSDVYGPDRGAAGISAPEANRGRVTTGMVADNYVWVQDQCRPLDPSETCQALQQAYDENEHQLRNAFQSQRAPLERREAQLQAQLASCGS